MLLMSLIIPRCLKYVGNVRKEIKLKTGISFRFQLHKISNPQNEQKKTFMEKRQESFLITTPPNKLNSKCVKNEVKSTKIIFFSVALPPSLLPLALQWSVTVSKV